MPYPDLPPSVKQDLATPAMREHHHLWHLVRNKRAWDSLLPNDQQQLILAGWQAPRFYGDPGSGKDFLGMHRDMIPHVNHLMSAAGDASWPSVVAWNPIPWTQTDVDWPVPPGWSGMPAGIAQAKDDASVSTYQRIASQLVEPTVLRQLSLDSLGLNIEGTIHAWMHNRWSAEPGDQWSLDVGNDYLGAPFSSHVNKHFWKLHGWIDERIGDWERANDARADLSDAWTGPSHLHAMPISADPTRARLAMPVPFEVEMGRVEEVLRLGRD